MKQNLLEFIHSTNEMQTAAQLTELFLTYLNRYGLNYFILSQLSYDAIHEKEQHHGIIGNYPEDWIKHYRANHYIEHDPVYCAALIAKKPFTWQAVKTSCYVSKISERVMGEARDCKLYDGIGISIYRPLGEIIGVGLASSLGHVDFDKNILSEILALTNQFYQVLSELTLLNVPKNHRIHLTRREIDVLGWLARGKTVKDISDIINISDATVRFHCQNIYKKLDVDNGRLAVAQAIRRGLISPY